MNDTVSWWVVFGRLTLLCLFVGACGAAPAPTSPPMVSPPLGSPQHDIATKTAHPEDEATHLPSTSPTVTPATASALLPTQGTLEHSPSATAFPIARSVPPTATELWPTVPPLPPNESSPPALPASPAPLATLLSTETPLPPPVAATIPLTALVTGTPTALGPTGELITTTPSAEVHLSAVGDVMLARRVGARVLREGPGVVWGAVLGEVAGADLLVANLECAISDRGVAEPKAYTFRAPPVAIEALTLAGVDVVSLANNHALDYGVEALTDTITLLQRAGIAPVGAGGDATSAAAPVVVARNGLRVAFLGFVDVPVERGGFDTRRWTAGPMTPGVAWAEVGAIEAAVAAARTQADVVVVLLHFGFEGVTQPSAMQRAQARAAIDAGAALVLGAHPHVLQGVERYGDGLIVYSLGNFVFDGFEGVANESAIFHARLTRDGVVDFWWSPVVITQGVPRPATEAEAAAILARVGPLH